MARFNMENADHYGTSGGTNYFSLKNDKDTARARFMYNTMEDVEGVAVHQIEIGDRKRYVNCLREYGSPVDSCPLCAARYIQKAKLFIPLYDEETDSIKVWERGKKFFAKLSSICSRYVNSETDLVNHVFEIERNGKAGDQQTTYEIYEVDKDDTTLEDLPEFEDVLGTIVLDKTAEELEYYLDNGDFPGENIPARRDSRRSEERVERRERRTPSRRSGSEDEF